MTMTQLALSCSAAVDREMTMRCDDNGMMMALPVRYVSGFGLFRLRVVQYSDISESDSESLDPIARSLISS
jgi:hypothetical protein